MIIKRILFEELSIPFKQSFSHNSARRNSSETIIVKAISSNDICGYGEGCPRDYVTGETLRTAKKFFSTYYADFLQLNDLTKLRDWSLRNEELIDENPSIWCAVEMSIISLLSIDLNRSIESILGLPELHGEFSYTAILGAEKEKIFINQVEQYHEIGFSDYKLKISGNLKLDSFKIKYLADLGNDIRVRLDANNLWHNYRECLEYFEKIKVNIFALEEPLQVGDFKGLQKIAEELQVKIILDENFLVAKDFEHIHQAFSTWIINLRISKMGGLFRSLEIANIARKRGIPIIIGAHVGETSVLTRAALSLANVSRDLLVAQEGALGTYLLEKDLFKHSLKFGEGGILKSAFVRSFYKEVI